MTPLLSITQSLPLSIFPMALLTLTTSLPDATVCADCADNLSCCFWKSFWLLIPLLLLIGKTLWSVTTMLLMLILPPLSFMLTPILPSVAVDYATACHQYLIQPILIYNYQQHRCFYMLFLVGTPTSTNISENWSNYIIITNTSIFICFYIWCYHLALALRFNPKLPEIGFSVNISTKVVNFTFTVSLDAPI